MVQNPELVEQLIASYDKEHPLTIEQKYALLNGMLQLARTMGAWPPKDPLEGIEDDIRLARLINSV